MIGALETKEGFKIEGIPVLVRARDHILLHSVRLGSHSVTLFQSRATMAAAEPSSYAIELLKKQREFLRSAVRILEAFAPNSPLFPTCCFRSTVAEMARNPPEGVSVGLVDDANMFLWELMIVGPSDTLYEGVSASS